MHGAVDGAMDGHGRRMACTWRWAMHARPGNAWIARNPIARKRVRQCKASASARIVNVREHLFSDTNLVQLNSAAPEKCARNHAYACVALHTIVHCCTLCKWHAVATHGALQRPPRRRRPPFMHARVHVSALSARIFTSIALLKI